MKLVFTLLILFPVLLNAQKLDDLSWLEGTWVNFTESDSSYEVWTRNQDGTYDGFGLTIINGDTVFYETLRIITKDGSVYYEAVIENQNEGLPVLFRLGRIKPDYTFVNRQHDFPQTITYDPSNDTLRIKLKGIEEYYEKSIELFYVRGKDLK